MTAAALLLSGLSGCDISLPQNMRVIRVLQNFRLPLTLAGAN
jgi:hypothetical protein